MIKNRTIIDTPVGKAYIRMFALTDYGSKIGRSEPIDSDELLGEMERNVIEGFKFCFEFENEHNAYQLTDDILPKSLQAKLSYKTTCINVKIPNPKKIKEDRGSIKNQYGIKKLKTLLHAIEKW